MAIMYFSGDAKKVRTLYNINKGTLSGPSLLESGESRSRQKQQFFHLVDEKTREAMDKRSKMPEASLRLERLAARWGGNYGSP